MQLGRTTAAIHHQDKIAVLNTGKRQLLPDDLDENDRLAQEKTQMLSSRVRDSLVRELVEQSRQLSADITMSTTEDERSDQILNAMYGVFGQLNERIGEILRTLDDSEQQNYRRPET